MATAQVSAGSSTSTRPRWPERRFTTAPASGQRQEEKLAQALGWFSVGLGLAEFLAPRSVARAIGAPRSDATLRLFGLREIANGVGILAQRRPATLVWGRVAGDMMDLAALGSAAASPAADGGRLTTAAAAVLGVTAADALCAAALSRPVDATTPEGAVRVRKAVTINRPAERLFRLWHDLENLPRWMSHLESVRVTGDGRSHWVARGPAGMSVEWDAETTEDRPAERIGWRSLPGAVVSHTGSVTFEPRTGAHGTVVRVELTYDAPGGPASAVVAKLFGREPGQEVQEDLRRFKQSAETGEVATTEGQPRGRCGW